MSLTPGQRTCNAILKRLAREKAGETCRCTPSTQLLLASHLSSRSSLCSLIADSSVQVCRQISGRESPGAPRKPWLQTCPVSGSFGRAQHRAKARRASGMLAASAAARALVKGAETGSKLSVPTYRATLHVPRDPLDKGCTDTANGLHPTGGN